MAFPGGRKIDEEVGLPLPRAEMRGIVRRDSHLVQRRSLGSMSVEMTRGMAEVGGMIIEILEEEVVGEIHMVSREGV